MFLKYYGVSVSYRDLGEKVFGDWEFERRFGIEDVDGVKSKFETRASVHLPDCKMFPHVEKTIRSLSQMGKQLGVVTSSAEENVQIVKQTQRILDCFGAVVYESDADLLKPDPEPIEIALKRLGAKKHDAAMVGDSWVDIEAAHRAGIAAVLVHDPDYHGRFYDLDKLRGFSPDFEIRHIGEIVEG